MTIDISDGIAAGMLSIRVLTVNETSMTLPADRRFTGTVIQPGHTAAAFEGEHGLAMYIEIDDGVSTHGILFDTGGVNHTILHNLTSMHLSLDNCEHVVISHGHPDHFGSLAEIIPLLPTTCDVVIHPTAFVQNMEVVTSSGDDVPLKNFDKNLQALKEAGEIIKDRKLRAMDKQAITALADERGLKVITPAEPVVLLPGVVTSGEIDVEDLAEMTPNFYLRVGDTQVEKQTFRDEIALYLHVQGKGLVILTGCGHNGINNIIRHARGLTGIEQVHAVIGGFHTEVRSASLVDSVVARLDEVNPWIVCGMHCTGLPFHAKMLGHESHVQGVVGTVFRF